MQRKPKSRLFLNNPVRSGRRKILPNVEEYTITENKDVSDGPVIQEIVADYYRDPKVMIDDRDELPAEENEEEEHVQFDIRQAIISSEILKRPQY